MLTLRFALPGVLLLAEHALAATTRAATMREVLTAAAPRPALWLVGDDGVFLMSNGMLTPPNAEHTTGLPVVHAAGYPTQVQWLAVAGQLGRGTPLRIVLPLLDPTPGGRILHDDLTAGATAGATALVIDLDTDHLRWHLPASAIHGGAFVTVLPMPDPIRRALRLDEMTAILGQIAGAVDVTKLLDITAAAVYDTLLADIGLRLAGLPEGQQVDPRNFMIPAQQHMAIKNAVTHRAGAQVNQTELAIRLIDLLPSTYDDPSAPVPDIVDSGPGPGGMQMSLTGEAVGVITAAGHHIQQLAHHYGPNSAEHVTAATTWLAALAQIISASSGPRVRVDRDGTLNLLVHTSGGYIFAVIFHGDARQCIAGDGCQALISDDGTAHGPYPNTPVAAHEHKPSFDLDAPRPGHWSTHS